MSDLDSSPANNPTIPVKFEGVIHAPNVPTHPSGIVINSLLGAVEIRSVPAADTRLGKNEIAVVTYGVANGGATQRYDTMHYGPDQVIDKEIESGGFRFGIHSGYIIKFK